MSDYGFTPSRELMAELSILDDRSEEDLYVDLGKALVLQEQASLSLEQPTYQIAHIESFDPGAIGFQPMFSPRDWFRDAWDYFFNLGKRYFRKINGEFLKALCKDDPVYEDFQGRLKGWIEGGNVVLATALVPILTGTFFGLGVPVATILAALIAKVTIKATYDLTCEIWEEASSSLG